MRSKYKAGIGGVIRDNNGDFVAAFSCPVRCESNNVADALAVNYGVKWCTNHGFSQFILEMDSMLICKIIQNKDTTHLKPKKIEEIVQLMAGAEIHVYHCYREANQVLAKLATSQDHDYVFSSIDGQGNCVNDETDLT
ncbi:hypothetical protein A4A49_54635 [Nicotiana attenuata]|uniref:RNase H type-1 domain-containing protein n=1 Tax=Nicotiana attenuata TaxID=49451 RepID=A0A1J6IYG1_NICAT|nr:hypothetical protein A4A49_54635 [Nicotiana attenuata]